MSDYPGPGGAPGSPTALQTAQAVPADAADKLQAAVREVMSIQDVTVGWENFTVRVRGQLIGTSEEAFYRLRPQFEALGHTPRLFKDGELDVVAAIPAVFGREPRRVPWGALIFFVLTLISVFWVGISNELYIPFWDAAYYRITGQTLLEYPADVLPNAAQFQEALLNALLYAGSLLGILGAHEMGHFLMARRYKVHTTFPFFIPLPFNILGTLGAVIAMREPAPNRKVQFDIGVAGPLAGLVVAVPVLVIGLLLSEVSTQAQILASMPASIRDQIGFFQEGQSLLYLLAKLVVFGQVLPQGDLDVFIHPVAFAGWAGLLVTALNLLPIGQLDGGHVLYGLFGEKAGRVRIPVLAVLVLLAAAGSLADAGILDLGIGWSGWWLWVALILFLVRRHAPVLDEITGLDQPRWWVGVLTLVIFVLIFTPRPLVVTAVVLGVF